jgi:hypothetical protein
MYQQPAPDRDGRRAFGHDAADGQASGIAWPLPPELADDVLE